MRLDRRATLVITLFVSIALSGCTATAAKDGDAGADLGAETSVDAGSDAQAPDSATQECDAPSPGCGECQAPVCEAGSWTCVGTPCENPLDCDEPAPDCSVLCEGGGQALCDEGEWVCNDFDGYECDTPMCSTSSTSTLSGVSIEIGSDRCIWTLAEVAAGIEIPYTVRITDARTIEPASQQNGCDEPGESGLRLRESVAGDGQAYCICDVGLCDDQPISVDLVPGEYQLAFAWDGVNWGGPSDTGNPKGEPFPAGRYTVEVRGIGEADGQEYEVVATSEIILTN